MNFFMPEESISESSYILRAVSATNSGHGSTYCSRPTDSSDVHILRIPYCSFVQERSNIRSYIRTLMISDTDFVRL